MNEDSRPVYYYGGAYGPRDEESHQKLQEFFRTATQEELVQTLIDAGIVDAQGNILPPYCDEPTPGLGPPPLPR